VTGPGRYARLFLAFARFGLAQEMAFRANFFIKLLVEALWLGILLVFYDVVFNQTSNVATWSREQYLFFVGCHYALSGIIETFFLENCTGFSELVRTGDLDRYLLRPIDEQFLITTRQMDWSTFPNVLQGVGVMAFALWSMPDWRFEWVPFVLFVGLFLCGVAMAYGFLLMLASTSVWMVRNQSLLELWWLFTTLMRYPREIFQTTAWANPIGVFFTYVVPVLIVVSVPAGTMVRLLDWKLAALMVVCAVLTLAVSRWYFRYCLRAYRSASS
jgi:ABC-2 type transport system permease protein